MGFIAKRMQARTAELKESAAGRAISGRRVGKPAPRIERFEEFAREGYQKNVIAYRCVSSIASAVANVPTTLFRGDEEQDASHEINKRLKRPNPLQSWSLWFAEVVSNRLITGNTYPEVVTNGAGIPIELWNLKPHRMTVIPGPVGIPEAYEHKVNGKATRYDVDQLNGLSDVRHIKTFHPLDDWYGMSPIQAAATGINQFNETGTWNQNLLINGASRGGVLELQAQDGRFDILSDPDYETLSKRLDEQFSGSKRAGRWKIAEGGLQYKPLDFSPQDMDWINGKHTSARDIANAFDYPTYLLGIPGDTTYSNYREARQAFYETLVMPMHAMFIGEFNVWLMPRWGDEFRLQANENAVLGLSPRREALWDRVAAATFLTIAEKRAATGYGVWEPTGEPQDDLYQPATEVPIGFDPTDEGEDSD